MKATQTPPDPSRRQRAQAIVEERVNALFRRMPMLSGFSVRQDLEVGDITVHTWPGYTAGSEFYEELMHALADLVDERPEAVELLRGRTFARALQ